MAAAPIDALPLRSALAVRTGVRFVSTCHEPKFPVRRSGDAAGGALLDAVERCELADPESISAMNHNHNGYDIATRGDILAVNALRNHGYSGDMPARKTIARRSPKPLGPAQTTAIKHPNRIRELTKKNKTTYGEIAHELGTSETQIGRLASGGRKLTQDWMIRLAGVLNCTPAEILEKPVAEGLRAIAVSGRVEAGVWAESHALPEEDHYTVMVPDDPNLRGLTLYAREINGESMNLLYPHGSVIVLSNMLQRPGEILAGKRYHVRVTRADGSVEETIKTLMRGANGTYWLKPESDSPEFTAIPLKDGDADEVILLGRVRWAVRREE